MTKSFYVFPTGAAGLALLLLRVSLSACLSAIIATTASAYADIVMLMIILGLLSGAGTRLFAGASACIAVIVCFERGGLLGFSAAQHGLAALALSILGAGGYSVDALLFGHRVIKIDR